MKIPTNMKTKSTLLHSTFGMLLLLSACFSPREIVRIEPNTEPDKWNYGQAILEDNQDNIAVSAAFAYSDPDFLVFDIEVTNWREEPIVVSPENIQIQLTNTERKLTAIDPEEHLLDMEIDESRREANRKNGAVVAGVAAVAAVTAAAVAAESNNNNDANGNALLNTAENLTYIAPTVVIASGGNAPPPVQARPVDPWFWTDYTLRKTTVKKGEIVRGKILFPRDNAIGVFELSVPVEELIFTFGFNQRLYFP